jgi:hypothetical protein
MFCKQDRLPQRGYFEDRTDHEGDFQVTCRNWALYLSVRIFAMLDVHQIGEPRCNANAEKLQAQHDQIFWISQI